MASPLRTELPFQIRRTTKDGHYYVQENLLTAVDKLDGVRNDMVTTQGDVSAVQGDVASIQSDVATLQSEVAALPKILRGNEVFPSGQTAHTVAHTFGSTDYQVALIGTGGDPGSRWWVSNKLSTSFDINVGTAPGANINFDWILIGG